MSTSYGLIIELSRNEKLQKYRIILSQYTNYLHKWLVYLNFDMFTAAMFSARFRNMCKPRTTFYLLWQAGPPGLAFYGNGPTHLTHCLGMMSAGCPGSMQSEIFLQIKFIIFQGCPTKQTAFLLGQPASYNQLLIQPILLIPECYLA